MKPWKISKKIMYHESLEDLVKGCMDIIYQRDNEMFVKILPFSLVLESIEEGEE